MARKRKEGAFRDRLKTVMKTRSSTRQQNTNVTAKANEVLRKKREEKSTTTSSSRSRPPKKQRELKKKEKNEKKPKRKKVKAKFKNNEKLHSHLQAHANDSNKSSKYNKSQKQQKDLSPNGLKRLKKQQKFLRKKQEKAEKRKEKSLENITKQTIGRLQNQLPSATLLKENMPWYQADLTQCSLETISQKRSRKYSDDWSVIHSVDTNQTSDSDDDEVEVLSINDTINVHTSDTHPFCKKGLESLTNEINSFYAYVRLTSKEIDARNIILNTISEAVQDIGNSGNSSKNKYKYTRNSSTHTDKTQTQPEIQVKTFGSFASLDVCTYKSDVDMAIWGFVNCETQENNNNGKNTPSTKTLPVSKDFSKESKSSAATEEAVREKEIIILGNDENDEDKRNVDSNSDDEVQILEVKDLSVKKEEGAALKIDDKNNEDGKKAATRIEIVDDEKDDEEELFISLPEVTATKDTPTTDKDEEKKGDVDDDDSSYDSERGYLRFLKSMKTENCPENDNNDNLSDDYDEEENDSLNNFEVSCTNENVSNNNNNNVPEIESSIVIKSPSPTFITQILKKYTNSTGTAVKDEKIKKIIKNTLYKLERKLTNPYGSRSYNYLIKEVEVRARARVPICNVTTHCGVEGDIAIGGHNGMDTSFYASFWILQHKSFAKIVVLLKILLNQVNLDKPFIGGLGSYKLYVLVAYHISKEMKELPDSSCPAHILLSFLYRYGGKFCHREKNNNNEKNKKDQTSLCRETTIITKLPAESNSADNTNKNDQNNSSASLLFNDKENNSFGLAELSGVFKIEDCTILFGLVYQRLLQAYQLFTEKNSSQNKTKSSSSSSTSKAAAATTTLKEEISFLSLIFNHQAIAKERQDFLRKAELLHKQSNMMNRKRKINDSSSSSSSSGKYNFKRFSRNSI